MNQNYIKELEARASDEAKKWYELNKTPEIEHINATLVDMDFDKLLNNAGDNPTKTAWNSAIKIACSTAYQESHDPIDVYHKAFFRLSEIVGIPASDFPKGWMSASLMNGYLEDHTGDQNFAWNTYDYDSIEKYFVNDVFDQVKSDSRIRSFSEESLRILLPKDANIVYKESIGAFVQNGDMDELVSHLYTEADSCLGRIRDGRRKTLDRVDVNCQLVADAMKFITKEDYSRHSVRKMLDDGKIQKQDFYLTKAYLDHLAPVVTNESMESYRKYFDTYENNELRDKLKSELSEEELFNTFIKGKNSDSSAWERALNCFALYTGKRLSFKEAYGFDIQRNFMLTNTSQYNKLLDKEFDIKSDTVTSNARLGWDIEIYDVVDDGEVEYNMEITVHSPALGVDGIYSKMEDAVFEVEANDLSVCWGAEIMVIESREESEDQAKLVSDRLKGKLDALFPQLLKEEPLPGDIVTLVYDEDEELEDQSHIPVGNKAMVVMRYDDSVKLKGIDQPIPLSNTKVSKKLSLEKEYSSELTI